jgi:hypothetical protein
MKAQESYLAGEIYSTCRVDLSRYFGPGRYTDATQRGRGWGTPEFSADGAAGLGEAEEWSGREKGKGKVTVG